MAARDRYKREIECPKCNEKGVLHISEDDYPFMKKLHRAVDGVDGDFSAAMQGEFDVKVTCKACGHEFAS